MYGKSPKKIYSVEVYEKWVQRNKEARRGAGNGMFGVSPWNHPSMTAETLAIWNRADEYFTIWNNSQCGGSKLAKQLNQTYNTGSHNNLIRKFKLGWIPWKDADWLTFKRASVEVIPIYFTSDLHLFHDRVIEYSNRPFTTVAEMHETLIARWNATVPSYGVVYVLGDVGTSNIEKLRSILNRLHGSLILISGNHDASNHAMFKAGFSCVLYSATLFIANKRVELNHCPPRGIFREDTTGMRGSDGTENWHGEKRHLRFSRDYSEDAFWLHGHTHKKPKERVLGKMFDVGVDANNFTPVSISQIESWITKYGR